MLLNLRGDSESVDGDRDVVMSLSCHVGILSALSLFNKSGAFKDSAGPLLYIYFPHQCIMGNVVLL